MKKLLQELLAVLLLCGCGVQPQNHEESLMDLAETDPKVHITDYLIEDFPLLFQLPELPTGCEVTALTMVLNYYGYDVDKTTMAYDYLPTIEFSFYTDKDGNTYGPDLNHYFAGDPGTANGYICGVPAIVTAANRYLDAVDSELKAKDMSSFSVKTLYEYVGAGIPAVVWVTIAMKDRVTEDGWYTDNGDYVDWSMDDHGAVLIGFTEETVTIADPLAGMVDYDKAQFESVFASRNHQWMILQA